MTNFGHEPGQPTDHLKLLHAYLASFPSLRRLVFHWEGERGLSPLSLATEPSLNSKTTGMPSQTCPQRCALPLRPLKFRHLQQMELVNNNGRVASGVFHPGAPEFPTRVQLRERGASRRKLGRRARAVDTTQGQRRVEAGAARHRHRRCADSVDSSWSQPETII